MSDDSVYDRGPIVNHQPGSKSFLKNSGYSGSAPFAGKEPGSNGLKPDGTVTNGRVLFDATRWRKDPFFGPDGFKVDSWGTFSARAQAVSV